MKDARIIVCQLVQKAGYVVRLSLVQLIIASALADLCEPIDMVIASKYIPVSSWETEIFNALVFKQRSIHFSIFFSGKVIVAGLTHLSLKSTIVLPTLL